jgi:hypothetical protein
VGYERKEKKKRREEKGKSRKDKKKGVYIADRPD